MTNSARQFTAADVIALCDLCAAHGIELWLDGGWAVDALLGAQTRPHNDIDIVLHAHAVPALRALLEARGYTDVPRDDTCPWNFVLGDDHGHEVDFHAIVLDAATGNGIYGPPEDGVFFPAAGLAGATGSVLGRAVRCLTPQQIVIFHTQYTPDANDIADVAALCAHFSIPYPASYPPAQ